MYTGRHIYYIHRETYLLYRLHIYTGRDIHYTGYIYTQGDILTIQVTYIHRETYSLYRLHIYTGRHIHYTGYIYTQGDIFTIQVTYIHRETYSLYRLHIYTGRDIHYIVVNVGYIVCNKRVVRLIAIVSFTSSRVCDLANFKLYCPPDSLYDLPRSNNIT